MSPSEVGQLTTRITIIGFSLGLHLWHVLVTFLLWHLTPKLTALLWRSDKMLPCHTCPCAFGEVRPWATIVNNVCTSSPLLCFFAMATVIKKKKLHQSLETSTHKRSSIHPLIFYSFLCSGSPVSWSFHLGLGTSQSRHKQLLAFSYLGYKASGHIVIDKVCTSSPFSWTFSLDHVSSLWQISAIRCKWMNRSFFSYIVTDVFSTFKIKNLVQQVSHCSSSRHHWYQ